jgi:uncharacterized protein (DUF486 family)
VYGDLEDDGGEWRILCEVEVFMTCSWYGWMGTRERWGRGIEVVRGEM